MSSSELAVLGGTPVRSALWPKWPRADQGTLNVVADVLSSARWAVSGASDGKVCYERRFAEAFAAYTGAGYCTPCTSGSSALTIALQAAGVGRGDEVLVPGLTWVACASAVLALGAVPVLVDIDPATLAMSPDSAEAALTPRTAAIMLVHLYCNLGDLDRFLAISQRTGIPLVEDCAQAHGAQWRGRSVGTFGVAGCFSMQQSKLLTAGEGGAVITNSEGYHRRLEQFKCDGRLFGPTTAPGRLDLVEVASVQGQNFNLSELQAAVLLDRLAVLDEENATRALRAERLCGLLSGVPGVEALRSGDQVTRRTYYNLVLRLEPAAFAGCTADAVARALSAELGTQVSPVYVPLSRHRLLCPDKLPRGDLSDIELARRDPRQYELPNAEEARRRCVTLTQPVLLDDEGGMDDVAQAITKVMKLADELLTTPQGPSAQAF